MGRPAILAPKSSAGSAARCPWYDVAMSSITKLLPGGGAISSNEACENVLELAFLMSAVDGHLADEELEAFRELVTCARGRSTTKADVDDLLERYVVTAHSVGVDERMREVAKAIPDDLRETAFKVAIGLSLVDSDASEFEYEMIAVLARELELGDRAIPLAKEARAVLGVATG